MMAMGFEARSLKNVMTTITDATAALGGGSEKLDRIVLALGQMYQYLNGEEWL
jgi:phage tail tape-measure protein